MKRLNWVYVNSRHCFLEGTSFYLLKARAGHRAPAQIWELYSSKYHSPLAWWQNTLERKEVARLANDYLYEHGFLLSFSIKGIFRYIVRKINMLKRRDRK